MPVKLVQLNHIVWTWMIHNVRSATQMQLALVDRVLYQTQDSGDHMMNMMVFSNVQIMMPD